MIHNSKVGKHKHNYSREGRPKGLARKYITSLPLLLRVELCNSFNLFLETNSSRRLPELIVFSPHIPHTKGWKPKPYALLKVTGRSVRPNRRITVPSAENHQTVTQTSKKMVPPAEAHRLDIDETQNNLFSWGLPVRCRRESFFSW